MKIQIRPAAFTLIELLVVISIIAILAGIVAPGLTASLVNTRITAATANARQVGLALRLYSQDHDGTFPKGKNDAGDEIETANDAFKDLFPAYLTTESIFTVATSKAGPKADNKIATPADILKVGENHWAYVMGLSASSDSQWPLVVDHTDGSGLYNDKEAELGGTWKGTKGIVIRADMSAGAPKLKGTGSQRYLPRFDDDTKNLLDVKDYMGNGVKLLEPAR